MSVFYRGIMRRDGNWEEGLMPAECKDLGLLKIKL